MRLRPARASVIALAAALALGGCSSRPEPAEPAPTTTSSAGPAETSASTTPTSTPQPTPAKPVLPEAAKSSDAAGQEAFVRYWFTTFDYAIATGDTEPMMAIADQDCLDCEAMVSDIEGVYKNNGHVEGGLHRVESIERAPLSELGIATPRVHYTQGAQVAIDGTGKRVEIAETNFHKYMAIGFYDESWHFYALGDRA